MSDNTPLGVMIGCLTCGGSMIKAVVGGRVVTHEECPACKENGRQGAKMTITGNATVSVNGSDITITS